MVFNHLSFLRLWVLLPFLFFTGAVLWLGGRGVYSVVQTLPLNIWVTQRLALYQPQHGDNRLSTQSQCK